MGMDISAVQTNPELVEQTWKEVGCRVRPLAHGAGFGRMVFIRTMPLEQKIGTIWLPPKLTSFHGELPHQKTIRGLVLSAGPKATVKPGELVCFTRLHFAWWKKLEDGCMVGWIAEDQLSGYYEGEE